MADIESPSTAPSGASNIFGTETATGVAGSDNIWTTTGGSNALSKSTISPSGKPAPSTPAIASNPTLVPPGPTPTSSEDQLNKTADQQFEQLVYLTPYSNLQKAQLKTAYYHQTTLPNYPDDLQDAYNKIIAQIAKGMPQGWAPTPNSQNYDEAMNTSFLNAMSALYATYRNGPPAVSSSDVQQVANALAILNGAPNTKLSDLQAIPTKLVAVATTMRNQALTQTQTAYAYPVFAPPAGPALPADPNSIALNTLTTADQLLTTAKQYVNHMPPGPDRMMMLSFLQIVSSALESLKNELYNIQLSGANQSTNLSNAQQEASQYKIKVHYKQMQEIMAQKAEIAKQQEKQSKYGGIMDALMPLIATVSLIMTVATAGVLGPVAFALCVTVTTLSVVDSIGKVSGKDIGAVDHVMNFAATMLSGGSGGPPALKFVMQLVVLVALTVAGGRGSAMKMVSQAMTFSTVLSSTSTAADLCKAANWGPETTQYVQMATVGFCAVVGLVGAFSMAAQNSEELAGRLAAQVAEISEKLSDPSLSRAAKLFNELALKITEHGLNNINSGMNQMKYLDRGLNASRVTTGSLQIVNSTMQYHIDMAQAALQPIIAAANAGDANMEDLINNLQATLQILEKFLAGVASWIGNVGNQSLQQFQQMEQIVSQMS